MRKVNKNKSHTEYNFLNKIKWAYTYIMFNINRAYLFKMWLLAFLEVEPIFFLRSKRHGKTESIYC